MAVALALSGALLGDALTTDMSYTNDPEAKRAEELIEARLRGEEHNIELVIVRSEGRTVDEPEFRAYVEDLQQEIAELGPSAVGASMSYYQLGDPSLVSADRRTTLIALMLPPEDELAHEVVPDLRALLARHDGTSFETSTFGQHSVAWDIDEVAKEDLATGEAIGILVALVVLLVVFGAVIAGLIPILMALASIVIATGTVAVVGQLYSFTFFVEQMIAMMGLALGIDYSLFVISRYREERCCGCTQQRAIEVTGATASRAVAFSGMTVVVALLGMLVVPMTMFRSLAAGAIFVALASILAALTLLPALLSLLGDRIDALRVLRHKGIREARAGGFWDRVSHGVMRRPVASVVVSAGVLAAAAVPYSGINLGFPGASMLPAGTEARRAFDIMEADFSGGLDSPVEIAIDADLSDPRVQQAIDDVRAALAGDGAFGPSDIEANPAGDLAVVSAPTAGDPSSDASVRAVERLRDRYIPAAFAGTEATVLVGGDTAWNTDGFDIIDRYLPIVFALVLGTSFVLLTVVFRSVVIALKAILMNLLSVGAAYGLLVLVFQEGIGAGVLGFRQGEFVAAWLPLFLFSVLFGLSMDYHVFLLSRIREHHDETGDNAASVAYGLRSTAGIITGAALIMVAVFAGFASGDLTELQQMGFGLGVAVLMDATIVRTVLVPASMRLLGNWNWYLPTWLRWLPELRVEAARDGAPVATPPAPPGSAPGARAPVAAGYRRLFHLPHRQGAHR
ncbi:MAG TPA: MMPL family transporter [Acidimicrobiales bacterium]|nr:MMPL family transporter [Acidimicrobiales bacterium]